MLFTPDNTRFPCLKDTGESVAERAMQESFIETACKLCRNEESFVRSNNQPINIGLEVEYPIVDSEFGIGPESTKLSVMELIGENSGIELASHQLEVRSEKPCDIRKNGFTQLLQDHLQIEKNVINSIENSDSHIVRIGTLPFVRIDDVEPSAGYMKYIESPQWHKNNQRPALNAFIGDREPVWCENPYVTGLMNSVHATIDSTGFSDAIDKLNRYIMISPLAVALGASARFIECRDTGWADIRLQAWGVSHDTRHWKEVILGRKTRVGLPDHYFTDMRDYLSSILEWPFILNSDEYLEHAFDVGHGLCWRDARLKWFRDKCLVGIEFRPVSLQPSILEDIAMVAFSVGRLLWSQNHNETLLPIKYVHANKERVERGGMNTTLYSLAQSDTVNEYNAQDLLQKEIDRAIAGLREADCLDNTSEELLEMLQRRIADGNPSSKLAKVIDQRFYQTVDFGQRKAILVEACYKMGLIQPL